MFLGADRPADGIPNRVEGDEKALNGALSRRLRLPFALPCFNGAPLRPIMGEREDRPGAVSIPAIGGYPQALFDGD